MQEHEDIPEFLHIPQETRDAMWIEHPPVPYTSLEEGTREVTDPGTLALMKELKEKKDGKRVVSLDKSASYKTDQAALRAGKRWDTSRARWV